MENTEEEFDYMVALQPALDKIEEETGEYFNAWIQPLRGEMVQEITDIKWTAVQMLIYWSEESGDDFRTCVVQFMDQFLAEMKNLEAQGWDTPTFTYQLATVPKTQPKEESSCQEAQ
jgi:hypothetical protein